MTCRIQLWDGFPEWAFLGLFLSGLFPAASRSAPPPVITVQPLDQAVTNGGTATFGVTAVSSTALSYQWYFNGNALLNATARTYSRTNAGVTNIGFYHVSVQNAGGTVYSSSAMLSVWDPWAYQQSWTGQYGGSGGDNDYLVAVIVDAEANAYATGYAFESESGSYDYVTLKYDPRGNRLWRAVFNGGSDDQASALALDLSGNVHVTGSSKVGNTWDYATVQYDPNGNQLWIARYNSTANRSDQASAVAVDLNGNVFVTGSAQNAAGKFEYNTIKYDPAGNQLWVRTYTGPGATEDDAKALALDEAGNVYVTGQSQGSGTGFDYATVKYSNAGNLLWVARYDGPASQDDFGAKVIVDAAQNVYVTGSSRGVISDFDYATICYDLDGAQRWVARYDGPVNKADKAVALAPDGDKGVFVTGSSATSANKSDYATLKYSSQGERLWVRRYDGPNLDDDQASALAVDSSGDVFVTGSSKNSVTGYDFVTIKYLGTNGAQAWLGQFSSPGNKNDTAVAVAVDRQSRILVAGQAYSKLDYALVQYQPYVPPPKAATLNASNVMAGSALLNAVVNPQGAATVCYFEYGVTTNYGLTSVTNALPAGTNSVPVTLAVAGLTPGTQYYYRVVATSAGGITNGSDVPFRTGVLAPFRVTGALTSPGVSMQLLVATAPGASLTVWCATNVNQPPGNWVLLGPMMETAAGLYQFIDAQPPADPQRFYLVRSP